MLLKHKKLQLDAKRQPKKGEKQSNVTRKTVKISRKGKLTINKRMEEAQVSAPVLPLVVERAKLQTDAALEKDGLQADAALEKARLQACRAAPLWGRQRRHPNERTVPVTAVTAAQP